MSDVNSLIDQLQGMSPDDRSAVMAACGKSIKVETTPTSSSASVMSPGHNMNARLSNFSGEKAKGEVSFEQWRYEVKGMVRDKIYPEAIILQAVRRSLRGTAADILLHLGETVSVDDVLGKFEKVFGNILPPEAILEKFFSAKQIDGERVATWACRLEDILAKLQDTQDESSPLVDKSAAATMLRNKFFSGLRMGQIKNAIRHQFDSKKSYEDLLVTARVAELETDSEQKTVKAHQATTVDGAMAAKLDMLLAGMDAMEKRMSALEQRQRGPAASRNPAGSYQPRPFVGRCYGCGQEGHPRTRCPLNWQPPVSGAGQQAASGAVAQPRQQGKQ